MRENETGDPYFSLQVRESHRSSASLDQREVAHRTQVGQPRRRLCEALTLEPGHGDSNHRQHQQRADQYANRGGAPIHCKSPAVVRCATSSDTTNITTAKASVTPNATAASE